MSESVFRALIAERLQRNLGHEPLDDNLVTMTFDQVMATIHQIALLRRAGALSDRQIRDRASTGNLARFLSLLPEGLPPASISRCAMGFLVRKQYASRTPPECAAIDALLGSEKCGGL